MPPWEQRLVTVTAKWQGFSVVNDRGVVVLLFRSKGQPSQRVSMTGFDPEIRFREEDEERAITYIRQTYKLWAEADGDRTLKDCLKEVKSTSDVQPQAEEEVTWATIAAAMKEAKLDFGKKIQPQTWKTNWAPILDEAVRVLGRKNAPGDGYELLKAVLKNWAHAPTVQKECGRYLARFMEFAVRRYKVPRSWLITQADRDELIPKRTKKRKKAVLEDAEILDFIDLVQQENPAWANLFRLLAQFGLRPVEIEHLTVVPDPTSKTGEKVFYCAYEKVGGQEDTEPRYLRPMHFRRSEDDKPVLWPLVEAWEAGTLKLPDLKAFNGHACNRYLHRKRNGKPAGPVQQRWKELIDKYAALPTEDWVRVYSLRDGFGVRCYREGLDKTVIAAAMGHSAAVHERSYRQLTERIKARAFESDAETMPLP